MPVVDAAVLLDSVLIAYRVLVRIAAARSNAALAFALLDRAQALGHARRWDRLTAAALLERTRLYLAEGRITEASASVAQLDQLAASVCSRTQSVSPEIETYRAVGAARLAMAQNRTEDAVESLNTALRSVERRHSDYLALSLRTVLALVWLEVHKGRAAIVTFRDVLSVAAPAGIYRSILDQGPEIGPLLQAVREDTPCTAQSREMVHYIDRLLDGWRSQYQPSGKLERDAERESLSASERNVVKLIAQGQSNKEIARTLGIAPETVKSHVKNIFLKLAVDKRAQAVARAQELGLVGRL